MRNTILSLGYIPVILILMPVALFLSTWLSVEVGRTADQFRLSGGFATMLPIIVLAPTFEELGWRGYGMDSLRAKFGMMKATLLFSVLWAMWHVPLFFIDHNYQHGLWNSSPIYLANFFVSVIPAAILMNWLFISILVIAGNRAFFFEEKKRGRASACAFSGNE